MIIWSLKFTLEKEWETKMSNYGMDIFCAPKEYFEDINTSVLETVRISEVMVGPCGEKR